MEILLDFAPMTSTASTLLAGQDLAGPAEQPLLGLCRASGDPLRLMILRILRNDSFGASELAQVFGAKQNAFSHHLKLLSGAGLVASRREGNSIFYRRAAQAADPELQVLQSALFAAADQLPLSAGMAEALSELQAQRARSSMDFFRRSAHKFREQQDLIADYEQYADTAAQVLLEAGLPGTGTALEVGPGDGAFLEKLAPRFKRVVALDNSAEMLARAAQRAEERALGNVEFIHGDTGSEKLGSLAVDCVVINMVLHHTPSPADIFRDVAACMAPGALLLVTDLCRHDQAWARENCGDLWLGFEPQDLGHWATAAGLDDVAGTFLAQRNGFQIQVRLFRASANHT